MALKNKEDEDDDDDDEEDSEVDLRALRTVQKNTEEDEASEDGIDAVALASLADGPPGRRRPEEKPARGRRKAEKAEEDAEDESAEEYGGAKASTSTALVPVREEGEEALKADHRASRWFSQEIFGGMGDGLGGDDDEEDGASSDDEVKEVDESLLPKLPLTDKEKRRLKRKKELERNEKRGKSRTQDKEEEAGPLEVAPLEAPKPIVPTGPQKPSDPRELAETLALGSLLVESKKSRMDIIDAAYNRWTFEADEGLPDWFTEEEEKHNKPELPISKDLMDQFRAKLREINARPIRKVAEAKARKKRRLQKRLEKLRSTAMSLADTPEMSEQAKAKHMRSAVSKMARLDERKTTVVAMGKAGGGRKTGKGKAPKGAKTKIVDKRLKADRRGEKKANKRNPQRKKIQARKQALKGKKGSKVKGVNGGKPKKQKGGGGGGGGA